MIGITVKKDSNIVVKIVILNEMNHALLLTRSDYHRKHAGELDLPGGHVQIGEKKKKGLFREVKEETGIKLKDAEFFKRKDNIFYYWIHLEDKCNITLSNEHVDYSFYGVDQLNIEEKFQKIAIQVMEKFKK